MTTGRRLCKHPDETRGRGSGRAQGVGKEWEELDGVAQSVALPRKALLGLRD